MIEATPRPDAPTRAEDAVQQLRTAWVQVRRVIGLIRGYDLFRAATRDDEAIAQLEAAQALMQGVAEAVDRERARRALEGE